MSAFSMPPVTTTGPAAAKEAEARDAKTPPEYTELKHRIHRRLLERINLERLAEIDAPRTRQEVRTAVASLVEQERGNLGEWSKDLIIDQVLNEVFGLGPLEPLMQDPTISDILVTTPHKVYVERNGRLVKTPVRFKDDTHLQRIIQKIVAQVGRRVDESSPMVDARLPDGSRVNAVIAPVSVDGPVLSIRRFARNPLTAGDLVRMNSLTDEMLALLSACVRARLNILVTGGTGTGKTTLAESIGVQGRDVLLRDLFVFEKTGLAKEGKVRGRFRGTEAKPEVLEKLRHADETLPESLFEAVVEV